jgi:hypothetical protein
MLKIGGMRRMARCEKLLEARSPFRQLCVSTGRVLSESTEESDFASAVEAWGGVSGGHRIWITDHF